MAGIRDADETWRTKAEDAWERAVRIVDSNPELDVSGVYHALRNLERSPEERLRRALTLGRLRAHGS